MAIDYTNLFTDIGKMLKYLNVYRGYSSTSLASDFDAISATLGGNDRYDILSGLPEQYSGFKDSAMGWSQALANRIESRLTNFETVVSQLPISNQSSISDVLYELINDMVNESESVDASTVTVGSATAAGTNNGDAEILTTKKMDGYSSPRKGFPAHPKYLNVDSEIAPTSETITITCTADGQSGGAVDRESFSIIGAPEGFQQFDWRSEGSGTGPQITVGNGSGMLSNPDFETFTVANTPDNWTIVDGTVGTHILKETSNVKRGTAALKYVGDGSQAQIKITQALTVSSLNPMRSYCIALWVRGHASITGTSALTIQLEGTDYTASSSEKISMNAAALAAQTSYGIEYFFVSLPVEIPTDLKLVITVSGTLTNSTNICFDGLMMVPTIWHGGVGYAIAAGAEPSTKNDRYTVAVSNNNAGIFQTLMRQRFGVQLPSNTSSSETIDDALAT